MAYYKKMYKKLVIAMSNSIDEMEKALREAEEIYISEEEKLRLQKFPNKRNSEKEESDPK